jgi:hypothetical protein
MKFINLLIQNKLDEAKNNLFEDIKEKILLKLEERKKELVEETYNLTEANPNVIRMGRISRVRRRIRRNPKNQIVVQRNRRRSNIKGYRVTGNTIKRIPVNVRLHKARMLKRSWKTTRKSKLRRSLQRRTMSMRRRQSMGIR